MVLVPLFWLCFLWPHASFSSTHETTSRPTSFHALPREITDIIWRSAMMHSSHIRDIAYVNTESYQVFLDNLQEICSYKHRILPNIEKWIAAAVRAGQENTEPPHLQEVLLFINQQQAKVFKDKQRFLVTIADWKRHGHSIGATILANWGSAIELARSIATEFAESTGGHVSKCQAWSAAWDSTWPAAHHALAFMIWYATRDAAKCALDNLMKGKEESIIRSAVYKALQNLQSEDPVLIGRVAFRVAETMSWVLLAKLQHQCLHKAYDAAYSKLLQHGESDPLKWFDSTTCIEQKMVAYFGYGSRLAKKNNFTISEAQYLLRYQYLSFYRQELSHINAQINAIR